MRRNMQLVLEKWGGWAVSEEKCVSVDWPSMSVMPQRPPQAGGRASCSDNDGLMIDGCIARLKARHQEELLMLGMRYIANMSLRQIAGAADTNLADVRRSLNASESFVAGCLAMLDVPLDMDPEVCE